MIVVSAVVMVVIVSTVVVVVVVVSTMVVVVVMSTVVVIVVVVSTVVMVMVIFPIARYTYTFYILVLSIFVIFINGVELEVQSVILFSGLFHRVSDGGQGYQQDLA